jgi:hypothetical protein
MEVMFEILQVIDCNFAIAFANLKNGLANPLRE